MKVEQANKAWLKTAEKISALYETASDLLRFIVLIFLIIVQHFFL